MSEDALTITDNLRSAFLGAIGRYDNWRRGDPEPEVDLGQGKYLPISIVCDILMSYQNDLLPNVHRRLLELVGGDKLERPSYRDGALCLAKLIREKRDRFSRD